MPLSAPSNHRIASGIAPGSGRHRYPTGNGPAAFAAGANDANQDQMRLEQACADFEALLIQKLFQSMRAAMPKSGFVDAGPAEAIYTTMLDQKVAQDLAIQGGLGLSSQIKAQIVRWMGIIKY